MRESDRRKFVSFNVVKMNIEKLRERQLLHNAFVVAKFLVFRMIGDVENVFHEFEVNLDRIASSGKVVRVTYVESKTLMS